MRLARFAARAAIAAPFVIMGWSGATEPGGRVRLAQDLGIPNAEAAVRFNGAAMVAGGIGLVTGILPRTAAAGLAVSLVPTTLAAHSFWKNDDPKMRNINRLQFLKNVGMLGGLLVVALATEGATEGKRTGTAGEPSA